jgi:hypothetical protein
VSFSVLALSLCLRGTLREERANGNSASGPASGVCKNGTGVSVTAQSVSGNPNVTSVSNSTSGKTSGVESGSRVQVGGLVVAALAAMMFVY